MLLLWLLLDLPDHPGAFSLEAFYRLPLEIPAIILLLLICPARARSAFIAVLTLLAATILFLKIADIGTQAAFQRPFNPYLDSKMILDGWNVLSGSVGSLEAAIAIAIVVITFGCFLWLFNYTAGFLALTDLKERKPLVAVCIILSLTGAALLHLQNQTRWTANWRIEANALFSLSERSSLILQSIQDIRVFEKDLMADDPAARKDALFRSVRGQDVFVIFVESLGRSALQDPRYASLIQNRLSQEQARLSAAGFQTASTWVQSPTVGGLSWLAHGTFMSGLWVDSQARYDRLIRSRRQSLNRLFQQAGWQTFAAMPAITMDWPESRYFGYDTVYAAKDLGYEGKPFNWITMPDQYTLAAIERLIRAPTPHRPAMIETALISSHAPWTPVASMIDWNLVGNGMIFNNQAEGDQSPSDVWKNPDNVRDHYIRTIDYSLQAVGSYVANYGRDALFIVIGDHQPAAIVTGPNASRDVPLFIMTKNFAVIEKFKRSGFVNGMLPKDQSPFGMDRLRNLLVETLS